MGLPSWLTMLFQINHPDEDIQRRGRNIIAIALGLTVLSSGSIISFLLSGLTPTTLIVLVATLVSGVIYLVAVVLARRGRVMLAAGLLTMIALVALFVSSAFTASASPISPFYFLLPILIASATMPPRAIWGIFGACLLTLVLLQQIAQRQVVAGLSYEVAAIYGGLLTAFAALIGSLNAGGMLRILRNARAAREAAEQSAAALAAMNATLETQVAARTAELQESLVAQQAQASELQGALVAQQRLNEAIAELSLPIIPVRHDALIIPLVGTLDSRRVRDMLSRVLRAIEAQGARVILLDVTGVPVIDSQVGEALLNTARAAALLGARTMLVGIRPEVAQTLVSLGIDLQMIETQATLQQGLESIDRR